MWGIWWNKKLCEHNKLDDIEQYKIHLNISLVVHCPIDIFSIFLMSSTNKDKILYISTFVSCSYKTCFVIFNALCTYLYQNGRSLKPYSWGVVLQPINYQEMSIHLLHSKIDISKKMYTLSSMETCTLNRNRNVVKI